MATPQVIDALRSALAGRLAASVGVPDPSDWYEIVLERLAIPLADSANSVRR